jgi:hydrogenase-4 component B
MGNPFASSDVFLLVLLLWGSGALGALVFRKYDRLANGWGNSLAILGAVAGMIFSLSELVSPSPFSLRIASSLPLLSLSFRVDALSAFFIFVISLIALLTSIYALGYVKHYYGRYDIGALGFFYNAFLAGMVMVVSASNAFFFLIVWEIMSLASYFLVIFEHREEEHVKAGSLYFIMTHVGTAFIILAFLLLYRATGSLDFGVIKANAEAVTPLVRNIIFVLALVGFGTKAGVIPLHIWLPNAHPAAPSHVSALMSGVMIKTGIYMFIRIFMDLMPSAPLWWGAVILILGAASSLLGVLYALTEHDIKKLLAYHSIENIGIILLGLGSSLACWSLDMKPLAVLGLVAALFHTLNHAVFKSLLFMGAGSVIAAAHTRNMEEYGGLIKRMPQTASFFLVGSLAISALPPFNGFFSEWLTFQSLFSGIMALDASVRWIFLLAAGSLAFTGGLAAMCFVKVFGATFLARPRSDEARHAKEPGIAERAGMAALAVLTVAIGFAASPIAGMLSGVVTDLSAFHSSEPASAATALTFRLRNGFAAISMPLTLAGLALALTLTFLVIFLVTRKRKIKIGATWDCGTTLNPRMEITSTGFARSIVAIFRGLLKPTRQVSIEYRDEDMRYFPRTSTVELGVRDIYRSYLYQPVHLLTIKASEQVKRIQSGNVNTYVLYILVTLVALLLAATI